MPRLGSLVITSGDPCGIGPEVILRALRASAAHGSAPRSGPRRLLVVGDLEVFERTARALNLRPPRWHVIRMGDLLPALADQRLVFVDAAHPWRFRPGASSTHAGIASMAYLEAAIDLCRRDAAAGLVTAPVTKWAIQRSHPRFVGQTEHLAKRLGGKPVMMFVSPELRVVLLTRHLAIRSVASVVTPALIRRTVLTTAEGLRRLFRIRRPRVAICGLNPHAGEAGAFGDEERRVLGPAFAALKRRGLLLTGPFAADGFFASARAYDAVLCWYHDQGLIPFKLLARDRGCQLSLGLPIVRTSPDHGSALDIAGKGVANPGSMGYAIRVAMALAARSSSRRRASSYDHAHRA